MSPKSVPCGGTNGANGFNAIDEDVAIACAGWIAPLLPLPCGNGSNGGVVPIVVLIDTGDVVVDVIPHAMISVWDLSFRRSQMQFNADESEQKQTAGGATY